MIKALIQDTKVKIKERDNYTCQHCHKVVTGMSCHASHVIPLSNCGQVALAWDPLNLKVLCAYCHRYFWHSHPLASGEWFRTTFPDRAQYLYDDYKREKIHISEIRELYDSL